MPNGEEFKPPKPPIPPLPPDVDKIIKAWEGKAREYYDIAQRQQTQIQEYTRVLERPTMPWGFQYKNPITGKTYSAPYVFPPILTGIQRQAEKRKVRQAIEQLSDESIKNYFYQQLYNEVPVQVADLIRGEMGATTDDIMMQLELPPILSADEVEEIRTSVDEIIDKVNTIMGVAPPLPEMALEAEEIELPELVPPTAIIGKPTTINQLTIAAIIKSLTAPVVPPSVMSEEEWKDFMVESGQISDKADLEAVEFYRDRAEARVAEWQERNNKIASYREGIAEMPDYELTDFLKELVIQPGLALMEGAMFYFEHVSMPLAGAVYGGYFPDLDAAFQRYRKTESTWMALGHAWEEWDPELWILDNTAAEWILKYMIMEGVVDPLTYAGWGIATRIAKPLGGVGRAVGAVERGIADVFEIPFNMLKFPLRARWTPEMLRKLRLPKKWAGETVIPRTPGQLAITAMHKTGQYVDKFMTRRFGKAVYQLTMKDWDEGARAAVKYVLSHPQDFDSNIARAGREFIKHSPIDEKTVWDWAKRLETTLQPEDITRQTIDSVDRVFEDFFSKVGGRKKLITNREAADELVRILHGKDPDMSIIAGKLLKSRAEDIITSAYSFGTLRGPFKAMRELMKQNYRAEIKTMEGAVALARKQQGRFVRLMEDTNLRVQKVWMNGIDKWVVRPFAESYLTFAMYGPMNVIEDVIRTMLGGVRPGAKSGGYLARKWAGTSYDQMLVTETSISETFGALRARPEGELNNWILQLGGLARGFGDNVFEWAVRKPGQISLAIRRHFIDAKATQILKQIGGDQMESLARVGPDKLIGVTGAKLVKRIQQEAMELKIQGLPDALRAVKGDWTRAKIVRNEVDNILKEHPDLPRPVRDHLMKAYDDEILFKEAGTSINNTMKDSYDVMVDDFIHSAEYAHRGFEQLADTLTQLEVRNPQEMAQLIQSLNTMSSVYGATPKQILGRAVERTRGLPFVERRASIDKALDDITIFREKAGLSMDKVVERIKVQMYAPRDFTSITSRLGRAQRGIPEQEMLRVQHSQIAQLYGYELEHIGDLTHRMSELDLRAGYEAVDEKLRKVIRVLDDPYEFEREFTEQITANLPHLKGKYATEAEAMEELRRLGGNYARAHEELIVGNEAQRIARDAAVAMGDFKFGEARRLLGILRTQIDKGPESWVEYAGRGVSQEIFEPGYISKAEQLFNLQTTKRLRSAEVGEEISAWRHNFFAEADPPSLHTNEFWDGFDREIIARHHAANVEMADFDGMIKNAIDDLDIAGGIPARQRPPIKVVDRELAPNDVAMLIGARGDDVSRALLDTMTAQNDRDMFVAYVMAQVKDGDIGFSKESVGAVFDQISASLHIPPGKMDWLAARNIELDAVRRDFHALYNSKMLPDDEIERIGRFFDDTADAVEDVMFDYPDDVVTVYRAATGKEGDRFLITTDIETAKIFTELEGHTGQILRFRVRRDKLVSGKEELGFWGHQVPAEKVGNIEAFLKRSDVITDVPKLKPEFTNYNDLRQQAMDEAHKWYYKEFTDYSNANMFDAVMKSVYPFWTYESQRWFWLPRSFVRHPGTFTAFERWQNNTDYGYLHTPGTSVDINPFRGTIYGTLSTRLARRDYPEYYDSLGAAGDVIEFSDFLSRYGFYPGAHIGIPLAVFGGVEMQFGEAMPSIIKTPLDAMIALYPDSESVKWISERVFGDRFRNYMTILTVNKLGGDGSLIFTKTKEGVALTEEEQQLWADARREVGWYSAGFEQFGLFRFRTDEQYEMYQKASEAIEEITGYTPEQQDWLRKHGYRIWDMVGGMSPTEQAILQELDYYRWVGNVRPLLPGRQQEILNKIELGWNAVEKYGETIQENKLQLQIDFLSGVRGPDDYNRQLLDLYDKQGEFIDNKIEEYPLMDLANRAEYYKEFNVPQPVLHPMRELLNLFFSIELNEVTDPETGEIVRDWDNFWAQRQAIEDAIPDDLKPEWEDFLARNSTRLEGIRREVYHNYFHTYNKVWEKILSTYNEGEQDMINEYLHLERTGQQLDRQAEIKATKSEKTGNMLISSFRSETSGAKKALRYHNPSLDAWLYYWGKTSTFTSPTGEEVYRQLAKGTGRKI